MWAGSCYLTNHQYSTTHALRHLVRLRVCALCSRYIVATDAKAKEKEVKPSPAREVYRLLTLFLRQANVGEFAWRLAMLPAFATQLRRDAGDAEVDPAVRRAVACVVTHLHDLYSLQLPVVSTFISARKALVEKKLKVGSVLKMYYSGIVARPSLLCVVVCVCSWVGGGRLRSLSTPKLLWYEGLFVARLVLSVRELFVFGLSVTFQDQVKIHKWDEQSYYSLKASAEKSHAVLHRLVSDIDVSRFEQDHLDWHATVQLPVTSSIIPKHLLSPRAWAFSSRLSPPVS